MADDDIDDLDISVPTSSPAAYGGGEGRTSSDDTFLFVLIAIIGGIALGWAISEFMRKARGRGGWNRGRGRGGFNRWNKFAPWGDDFRMMQRYRRRPRYGGPMPADYTRRDYYSDLESNHIRDIHEVIPRRRMTPLIARISMHTLRNGMSTGIPMEILQT